MKSMVRITEDVPLAALTTFRIGGCARFFAEILTEDDLLEALEFAGALPVFILGGGSNVLIPDRGFPGVVLHLGIKGPLKRSTNLLEAPAGTDWDELVLSTCEKEMSGMECLAGIPGLVGAAPIQNIGAYGQEVSETVLAVRAYDRVRKEFVSLGREECQFGYRQSIFNTTHRNRYILTRVTFEFSPQASCELTYPDLRQFFASASHTPTPLEIYEAVRAIRNGKGMLLVADDARGAEDTRSAGSFFKNPLVLPSTLATIAGVLNIPESAVPRFPAPGGRIKLPAAWLLERAGFHKSHIDGEAGISSRHTLALINRGQASYADLTRLRDQIVETVRTMFNLTLEQEPTEP